MGSRPRSTRSTWWSTRRSCRVSSGFRARARICGRCARTNGRALEPLATIVSQAYVADDFAYLARTPANAGAKALEKAGRKIEDVERVELNEAFSSVVLNST